MEENQQVIESAIVECGVDSTNCVSKFCKLSHDLHSKYIQIVPGTSCIISSIFCSSCTVLTVLSLSGLSTSFKRACLMKTSINVIKDFFGLGYYGGEIVQCIIVLHVMNCPQQVHI